MATCKTLVWKLNRYARSKQPKQQGMKPQQGVWEYFDDSERPLQANLQHEGFFVINHGAVIMESFNLVNGQSWIRGTTKGDSMLLISKITEETRRCRIKFSRSGRKTGEEVCRESAHKLSQYFPLKIVPSIDAANPCQDEQGEKGKHDQFIEGEITLGEMAKILTKDSKYRLTEAYHKHSASPVKDIDTVIRLCLSDPTFPAFVAQVEQKLNEIKQENV